MVNWLIDWFKWIPRQIVRRIDFRISHILKTQISPQLEHIIKRIENTSTREILASRQASELAQRWFALNERQFDRQSIDLSAIAARQIADGAILDLISRRLELTEARIVNFSSELAEIRSLVSALGDASTHTPETLQLLLGPVQARIIGLSGRLTELKHDLNTGLDDQEQRLSEIALDVAQKLHKIISFEPKLNVIEKKIEEEKSNSVEHYEKLSRFAEVADLIDARLNSLDGVVNQKLNPLSALMLDISVRINGIGQKIDSNFAMTYAEERTCEPDVIDLLSGKDATRTSSEARTADLLHDIHSVSLHQLARQVIPLEDNLTAVRTPEFWVVVPREESRSLIHLADGWSGHEPGTVKVVEALIALGETVVDVGAHIGLLTLPMANAVGAGGKVYAFEPQPRMALALRRTLEVNSLLDRVEINAVAVGAKVATANLHLSENAMSASLYPVEASTGVIAVPVTTLDDALANVSNISLIKVDAEGAELSVLLGARHTLSSNNNAVIIAELGATHLTRTSTLLTDWFAQFQKFGFQVFYEIRDQPPFLRAIEDIKVLQGVYSVNILFMRADKPFTLGALLQN